MDGPCPALAAAVGSRLAARLAGQGAGRVAVRWEPWGAYCYRVRAGERQAVQYVTGALLQDARSLDAIAEEIAGRIAGGR